MKIIIPEWYEVLRDGVIVSHRKRAPMELRQYLNGSGYGYPSVYLYYRGSTRSAPKRKFYAVHRLVAAVFLPPRPSPKYWLLHRDDDRQNPHADNLYWGTPKENYADMVRNRSGVFGLAVTYDEADGPPLPF